MASERNQIRSVKMIPTRRKASYEIHSGCFMK